MTAVIAAHTRVVGVVRGREIDASASVTLDQDTLVLAWQDATPWRLSLSGIEGIAGGGSSLTVYLVRNDVLELSGDDQLRALGRQLLDRACAMPELTRGLKSLGSSRGTPVAAHDRWFAPLLAARRAVEGVSDPARQVMLLDAAARAKEGAFEVLTKKPLEAGVLERRSNPRSRSARLRAAVRTRRQEAAL